MMYPKFRAFLRMDWFILLASALGATPLIINLRATLPYEPPKIFFIMLVAEAAVLIGILRWIWRTDRLSWARLPLHLSGLDIAVLVWFIVVTASVITSVAPVESLLGSYVRRMSWIFVTHLLLLYFFLRSSLSWKRAQQFMHSLLLGSGVVSSYAIVQHFEYDFVPWLVGVFRLLCHGGPVRVFSTLGHPNFLGAYLAMLMPLTGYVCVVSERWRMRSFWGTLFLMQVLALVWTFNRSAWLAGTIAIAVMVTGWLWQTGKRRVFLGTVAVGMIGVIAFGVLFGMGARGLRTGNWYFDRITSIGNLRAGSPLVRIKEWSYLLQYVKQRPVLGYGPETFPYFYKPRPKDPREKLPDCSTADPTIADRAHNQFLDIALSSGLLGLSAWLVMIVIAFFYCFRRGRYRIMRFTLGSSLVAYLVQNQFSFDFSISLLLFFVFLASVQAYCPLAARPAE